MTPDNIMDELNEIDNLSECFLDALIKCSDESKHAAYLIPLCEIFTEKIHILTNKYDEFLYKN